MDAAAARRSRRRDETRREIVAGAQRVALRDGLDGFTLESVARAAGVTKQGLLYHFPSKDALVFEVFLTEWKAAADQVAAAVDQAGDGGEALAALIRSYVDYYAPRLDVFRLITQEVQRHDAATLTAEQLGEIRPLNDLLYGGAEAKLEADGAMPRRGNARRLAFAAHMAAFGLLTMKALVERFGDPLRHSDADMVDEMCRAFAAAAGRKES